MPLYNPTGAIPAGSTTGGALTIAGDLTVTGNVIISTVGKGLQVKEGSNAKMGTGTLSGGTVTIATTAVTTTSRIVLTDTTNAITNLGALTVSSISAGVSFTVKSANVLDTSTFNWMIVEAI